MLDSGRYDIPDIAAKVAKPEPFIAQRLKLNDLIDEIKDDFIHNVLSIGHAVKIARLDPKLQEGLVKNFKRRWDMQGWGTLKQLEQEIKTQSYDLGKAVFSLELGYGEIAPCAGCHFRSSTNPLLFADMQTDSCFNKPCYNGKVTAHLEAEAEKILTEGSDVILVSLNNSNVPDSINTMADKLKKPVIRTAKDNQTANSLKKKAFVVGGSKAGQLIDVWIPKAAVPESGTVLSTADEINKIEERAVRMLELDQEKIHANIITSLKGEFGRNKLPEFNIDKDMLSALAWFVLMDSLSYDICQQLKALKLPFRQDYASVEELHQDIAKLLPDQRKAMLTVILFEKYKGTLNAKHISGKIIRYLADANPNVSIKDIEAAQNEIAAARIARTDSRLAELRKKQDKPSKKESKKKGLLSVLGKKDNGLSALLNDKTK
jgi:hypothetical protein